jgi:hypothetical protein
MPVYFAGWVKIDPVTAVLSIRFGGGFAVSRIGAVGGYRITISQTLTTKFLATVVTPVVPSSNPVSRVARVVQFVQDPLLGVSRVDIEIRDMSGNLVDCDFNFIMMERS